MIRLLVMRTLKDAAEAPRVKADVDS